MYVYIYTHTYIYVCIYRVRVGRRHVLTPSRDTSGSPDIQSCSLFFTFAPGQTRPFTSFLVSEAFKLGAFFLT